MDENIIPATNFMENDANIGALINAFSLPTAICNKHGNLLKGSKSFNRLWSLDKAPHLQAMFYDQSRWQSDWRSVLRNRTADLLETRLCAPLDQLMLRTTRLEQQHTNEPLFLLELHPRKEFTGGFTKLADYYSQKQRHQNQTLQMNKQMQQAFKESHTDPLTGIANRRAFDEHLQEVWQNSIHERRSLALFSADIDHFKKVNDLLGHSRGDEILVQVAQGLNRVLSRYTDVVARVGGEEFAMVLPNTPFVGGKILANSAVSAISNLRIAHPASSTGEWVTISLGCTWIQPSPSNNINDVIKAADEALYYAKQSGRNCASYMDFESQSLELISSSA